MILNFLKTRKGARQNTYHFLPYEMYNLNYHEYFFKQSIVIESEPISSRLKSLSIDELKMMGQDILSIAFNTIRAISDKDLWKGDEAFYSAFIFNLSDSVHNIPYRLGKDFVQSELIDYITEFLVFVESLDRLNCKPHERWFIYNLTSYRKDIRNP